VGDVGGDDCGGVADFLGGVGVASLLSGGGVNGGGDGDSSPTKAGGGGGAAGASIDGSIVTLDLAFIGSVDSRGPKAGSSEAVATGIICAGAGEAAPVGGVGVGSGVGPDGGGSESRPSSPEPL